MVDPFLSRQPYNKANMFAADESAINAPRIDIVHTVRQVSYVFQVSGVGSLLLAAKYCELLSRSLAAW